MAVSLFAAEKGFLDDVDLNKIVDFEQALIAYMRASHADLMDRINETAEYNDEIEAALNKAVEDFRANSAY